MGNKGMNTIIKHLCINTVPNQQWSLIVMCYLGKLVKVAN